MTQDEQWLLKEKYEGVECFAFHADCERLAAGEPLAYVIGHVPFLNTNICLDSHPLIPRPETEYWVEKAINAIRKSGAPEAPHILDLCAGSGCIGVAIAKALPASHVTFGEIEAAHLTTITKNLAHNLTNYSIRMDYFPVIQSNLFSNIPGKFDYILSNPPYIDPALDRTQSSVKNHEPHEALYGGTGGLALIERIIADTSTHLTKDGQLWLEHEPEQSEAIATLARQTGFTITTHTDQYKIARYSILTMAQ